MATSFDRVMSYYREFLRHEDDARKVAWRTRFDQELRFENLVESVAWPAKGLSVLDVGCGLGHLADYLENTDRQADYHGVDIVPEMVEAARARRPDLDIRHADILRDEVTPADLVVCSGSLTVRVPQHESFVVEMVERMLALARWAVVVNFQSTRAFRYNPLSENDPDLFHVDPLSLYGKLRDLCRFSALREDVLGTDFTVVLYPGHALSIEHYRLRANPEAWGLAFLYLERRLPAAALAVLEDVEETADVLNLRGMAHQRLGQRRLARRSYRAALRLDPDHEAAKLNLEGVS